MSKKRRIRKLEKELNRTGQTWEARQKITDRRREIYKKLLMGELVTHEEAREFEKLHKMLPEWAQKNVPADMQECADGVHNALPTLLADPIIEITEPLPNLTQQDYKELVWKRLEAITKETDIILEETEEGYLWHTNKIGDQYFEKYGGIEGVI